jgi:hypothetical protein
MIQGRVFTSVERRTSVCQAVQSISKSNSDTHGGVLYETEDLKLSESP